MTDRAIVFRKVASLREQIGRMRRRRAIDLEGFLADNNWEF